MAGSATLVSMQAFAATSSRNGLSQVGSFGSVQLPKRSSMMKIRSMADDNEKKSEAAPQVSASTSSPVEAPKPSQPMPTPTPPKPKVSTKFEDILAFGGPAPERINGRLAMIGFVAAMGVELSKGQDLFSQINDGGFQWFLGTSILLSMASLIPLFKGDRAEKITKGVMNSDAELWNGRFAMLGLVALAFTEYVIGGALV